MKYLTLLSLFMLFSCQQGNSELLEKKVMQLKNENKKLKDSLNTIAYNNLVSSELVLLPQLYTFHDDTGMISGIFRQRQNFPKFNLYYADEQFKYKESDKIDYTLTKDNGFSFNFDKRKVNETLKVTAIFDLDTVKVQLYGIVAFPNK